MKPLARYLELVATVQYLLGRGHVFTTDEDAFYWGSKLATLVVIVHAATLSAFVELLIGMLIPSGAIRWGLHVAIWGLALAILVFLQSNTAYVQELRERLRYEPGGSSNRERGMWAFLIGSVLLALIAGISWIAHAI